MPKVTVQAYAILGDILKSRDIELSTPAQTVRQLVDVIAHKYGLAFKQALIDPQTQALRGAFRILVNGCNIESLNSLETKIGDGDKILFFPPISGG